MPAPSRNFEALLLDSIDEAMLSLGGPAKQSIYFHLEKNFKVSRNQIPEHLEQFQTGLEKIFGLGARFLEILIMKNLYAKIGCPLAMEKNEPLEFVRYVEAARQSYLNSCDKEEGS